MLKRTPGVVVLIGTVILACSVGAKVTPSNTGVEASPSAEATSSTAPAEKSSPTAMASPEGSGASALPCADADAAKVWPTVGKTSVEAEFALQPNQYSAWHDSFIRATGVDDPGHPGPEASIVGDQPSDADAPVSICYLSGEFAARGADQNYDRLVLVLLPDGEMVVVAAGNRQSIPLVTPAPPKQ
jgi:hypothetical protein